MARVTLGPVVKSERRRFDRILPNHWWIVKIHYNIDTKIFSIPFPPEFIKEFPQQETPAAKTIEAAMAKFNAGITTWEASNINIEKVICYRFPITYARYRTTAKGKKVLEYSREDGYDSADDKSMGLGFEWTVAYRRQVTGQRAQYFHHKEGNDNEPDFESHLSSDLEPEDDRPDAKPRFRSRDAIKITARWVKWSQERETLLRNMGVSFGKLIEGLMAIEKQLETEEGMAAVIARSGQLLLTSGDSHGKG